MTVLEKMEAEYREHLEAHWNVDGTRKPMGALIMDFRGFDTIEDAMATMGNFMREPSPVWGCNQ